MKKGISMLLSAAILAISPVAADEEQEEKIISKSGTASVKVNVNTITTSDGEESDEESVVTGRIVIVGPDGEKKEYDLNDELPEGFEKLVLPGGKGDMSFLFKSDDAEERFMIGVGCEPASDVLRRHLRLGETGLVVTQVSEKLPAAAAGVGSGDILLSVGDRKLSTLEDLVEVVTASEGKALTFQVMQDGDKAEVAITPKKTTASIATMGFPQGLEKIFLSDDAGLQFDIDMEEIEDKLQNSQGNFIIRRFGPGIRMRGNVENGINLDIDQLIDGAVEEIEMIDLSEAATSDLKAEMEMLKKRLAGMEKKLKALKKSGGEK